MCPLISRRIDTRRPGKSSRADPWVRRFNNAVECGLLIPVSGIGGALRSVYEARHFPLGGLPLAGKTRHREPEWLLVPMSAQSGAVAKPLFRPLAANGDNDHSGFGFGRW